MAPKRPKNDGFCGGFLDESGALFDAVFFVVVLGAKEETTWT